MRSVVLLFGLFVQPLLAATMTCPSPKQVSLGGVWNLTSSDWTIASSIGSPGPCPVVLNVAWAPHGDHELYIQCWYQSGDGNGALMIFFTPSNLSISNRFLHIVSPVLCAFANAPDWAQFVDPETNKTSHLYNCDWTYSDDSDCPKTLAACSWDPARTKANVTLPECK